MINSIFFYISNTFKIQSIHVYSVNLYLSKDFFLTRFLTEISCFCLVSYFVMLQILVFKAENILKNKIKILTFRKCLYLKFDFFQNMLSITTIYLDRQTKFSVFQHSFRLTLVFSTGQNS